MSIIISSISFNLMFPQEFFQILSKVKSNMPTIPNNDRGKLNLKIYVNTLNALIKKKFICKFQLRSSYIYHRTVVPNEKYV